MSLSIPWSRLLVPSLVILGGVIPGFGILRADVIYTNFGTGDAYSAGSGLIVTNDSSAWSSVAVSFTPLANYTLTSIEFVATNLIPGDADITLGIFADNAGQPGGSPLESFGVSGLGQFGDTAPVLTLTSLLQPLLLADTAYWIGMEGPANGFVVWNQNSTLAEGFSQTDGSGNWSTAASDQGVVEIDGALAPDTPPVSPPVSTPPDLSLSSNSSPTPSQNNLGPPALPEPGTWWSMAGGLAVLFLIARKARARLADQKQ